MRTLQATELRKSLFKTLKRVAYEKTPVMIRRHGKNIAALIPAEELSTGSTKPTIDPLVVAEFCKRHRLTEFSLFGSILRDDFGPESDVDVMIDFPSGSGISLLDLGRMVEELKEILGRNVDLAMKRGVERDHCKTRRDSILNSAKVIYAKS